jgi:hypothetical protein
MFSFYVLLIKSGYYTSNTPSKLEDMENLLSGQDSITLLPDFSIHFFEPVIDNFQKAGELFPESREGIFLNNY